jgi:hypothetical protein
MAKRGLMGICIWLKIGWEQWDGFFVLKFLFLPFLFRCHESLVENFNLGFGIHLAHTLADLASCPAT